jgi:hypothetical protein
MSLDEKVETIEHSSQEVIRLREERREMEATKLKRRGTLLFKEDERTM